MGEIGATSERPIKFINRRIVSPFQFGYKDKPSSTTPTLIRITNMRKSCLEFYLGKFVIVIEELVPTICIDLRLSDNIIQELICGSLPLKFQKEKLR